MCVCVCLLCVLAQSVCVAPTAFLALVTTILTPFVCVLCVCVYVYEKERKSGISKQAIVNIVRTEWRPPTLRAAFEPNTQCGS